MCESCHSRSVRVLLDEKVVGYEPFNSHTTALGSADYYTRRAVLTDYHIRREEGTIAGYFNKAARKDQEQDNWHYKYIPTQSRNSALGNDYKTMSRHLDVQLIERFFEISGRYSGEVITNRPVASYKKLIYTPTLKPHQPLPKKYLDGYRRAPVAKI